VKVIALASLKGGVGKTSCAAFLSQALASIGSRVLAVDIDANNNLTDYFLRDANAEELEARNIRQVLIDGLKPSEAVYYSSLGVDVLPATPHLHRVGVELAGDPGALLRFAAALRRMNYDLVVIDTPPAMVMELRAALYAAEQVLVPIAYTRWTIVGYQLLRAELDKVAETTGVMPFLQVVPSCVTVQEAEKLRGIDAWKSTTTGILRSSAIKAAGTSGRALKKESKSWAEFLDLAREVQK